MHLCSCLMLCYNDVDTLTYNLTKCKSTPKAIVSSNSHLFCIFYALYYPTQCVQIESETHNSLRFFGSMKNIYNS